jgi:tRNA 2-thiouridine synthesizing protein E
MHEDSNSPQSMEEVLHPGSDAAQVQPGFPDAPRGWSPDQAEQIAKEDTLTLVDDHWEAIRMLQDYFKRHTDDRINPRELHDALDEKFHASGGLRYLYEIFPKGPVAQGCRMAGLKPPAGVTDPGFGHAV